MQGILLIPKINNLLEISTLRFNKEVLTSSKLIHIKKRLPNQKRVFVL